MIYEQGDSPAETLGTWLKIWIIFNTHAHATTHTQEYLMTLPSSYDFPSSIHLVVVAFHYWIYIHGMTICDWPTVSWPSQSVINIFCNIESNRHRRTYESENMVQSSYVATTGKFVKHHLTFVFSYLKFGRRRADVLLYSTIHHPLTRS